VVRPVRENRPASSYKRRTDDVRHLQELLLLTFDRITAPLLTELYGRIGYDSPRTGLVVSQTVKMILRDARARGQRVPDSAIEVRPPRYRPGKRVFLTLDQVNELIAEASDPHMANILRFAFFTGLRQHECFDLSDADVSPHETSVLIARGKTKSGHRTVPLIGEAQEIIRVQRRLRTGGRAGSNYIFPAPRGGRWRLENFNDDYRMVRKRLPTGHPLRYVPPAPGRAVDANARNPFHALRHSFASHMIAAGVQPKVLQVVMGHASIQVTLDTYGHLFPGADEAAMERFATFLRS
jgi:integrase